MKACVHQTMVMPAGLGCIFPVWKVAREKSFSLWQDKLPLGSEKEAAPYAGRIWGLGCRSHPESVPEWLQG